VKLIVHAAALIEYQTDGERGILAREIGYLLFDPIFEELKIFLLKPEDEPVVRIRYRHRDEDERRINSESGPRNTLRALRSSIGLSAFRPGAGCTRSRTKKHPPHE